MVDLLELADLAEESIYLTCGTTSLGPRHRAGAGRPSHRSLTIP